MFCNVLSHVVSSTEQVKKVAGEAQMRRLGLPQLSICDCISFRPLCDRGKPICDKHTIINLYLLGV